MSLKKKQKEVPVDASVDERAKPYCNGKKHIGELDFRLHSDVEVARYCLQYDFVKAREFDVNNERHLAVLKTWIGEKYDRYITCVNNNIENVAKCSELLAVYLRKKMADTLSKTEGLSFINSYDKKLVLNYHYETKRGETISYFDTALGVPTSLVATANIRLKLIDAQKLVEKVDVDIHEIDAPIVVNFITSVFNSTVRDIVLSFITTNNLSFYDLAQHYTELNQAVLDKLSAYFASCGLLATHFTFSDISVPNNTDQLLKNQFFAIAEAERIKAHEQKVEKASLDLYERKAAIHSKYPDFPITLTEAEKDFALNRYLTRTGHDTTLKADIKEKALAGRTEDLGGTETKDKAVRPTSLKVSNKFRLIYSLIVMTLYVVACAMFAGGMRLGFAALAGATFCAGITAVCFYKKLKYGTKTERITETDNTSENSFQQTEPVASSDSEDTSDDAD